MILPTTILARKEAILRAGGFDETLKGNDDTHLWYQMAAQEHRFACVEAVLSSYRIHPGQTSHDREARYRRQIVLLDRMLAEPIWKPEQRLKIGRKLAGRYTLLGNHLACEGRIPEAAQSYGAATKLRPSPMTLALLAAAKGGVWCRPLGRFVLRGLLRIIRVQENSTIRRRIGEMAARASLRTTDKPSGTRSSPSCGDTEGIRGTRRD